MPLSATKIVSGVLLFVKKNLSDKTKCAPSSTMLWKAYRALFLGRQRRWLPTVVTGNSGTLRCLYTITWPNCVYKLCFLFSFFLLHSLEMLWSVLCLAILVFNPYKWIIGNSDYLHDALGQKLHSIGRWKEQN